MRLLNFLFGWIYMPQNQLSTVEGLIALLEFLIIYILIREGYNYFRDMKDKVDKEIDNESKN